MDRSLSRLPVVNRTAWVNSGNRPERQTASSTRTGPSARGSIGGRGVHMTACGISVVMKAPRMYFDTPVAVPLLKRLEVTVRVQHGRKRGPTPPKPDVCPTCGLPFESRVACRRHKGGCSKEGAD